MSKTARLPTPLERAKYLYFAELLMSGEVFITFNKLGEGCDVPKQFLVGYHRSTFSPLCLKMSNHYADLQLEMGLLDVKATIHFDSVPYRVTVPWAEVYIITTVDADKAFTHKDSRLYPPYFNQRGLGSDKEWATGPQYKAFMFMLSGA